MIQSVREKWLQAGIKLSTDSKAKVMCPECEKSELVVQDVYIPPPSPVLERHLICPSCGAYNAILNPKGK